MTCYTTISFFAPGFPNFFDEQYQCCLSPQLVCYLNRNLVKRRENATSMGSSKHHCRTRDIFLVDSSNMHCVMSSNSALNKEPTCLQLRIQSLLPGLCHLVCQTQDLVKSRIGNKSSTASSLSSALASSPFTTSSTSSSPSFIYPLICKSRFGYPHVAHNALVNNGKNNVAFAVL